VIPAASCSGRVRVLRCARCWGQNPDYLTNNNGLYGISRLLISVTLYSSQRCDGGVTAARKVKATRARQRVTALHVHTQRTLRVSHCRSVHLSRGLSAGRSGPPGFG